MLIYHLYNMSSLFCVQLMGLALLLFELSFVGIPFIIIKVRYLTSWFFSSTTTSALLALTVGRLSAQHLIEYGDFALARLGKVRLLLPLFGHMGSFHRTGCVRSCYDGQLLFSSLYYLVEYHSRLGLFCSHQPVHY